MNIVDSFRGAAPVASLWKIKSLDKRPWQLRWKPVCASTEIELSNWLRDEPLKGSIPRAFLAARQNHGIGQRGRTWEAPNGGVWISAAMPFFEESKSSGIFGLAVAVALAKKIESFDVPVQIKWPNDLVVRGRKLAGFLPRLIHRGDRLRIGRIGLGLNVCNRVPKGAISLHEIFRPRNCQQLFWAVEVLLALASAKELMPDSEYVCSQAERMLWANAVKDPKSGAILKIEGLTNDGALKLRNGSCQTIWNRWD